MDSELCDDVLFEIMSFLPLDDILTLGLVNSEFYHFSTHDRVWKRIFSDGYDYERVRVTKDFRNHYLELKVRDVTDCKKLKRRERFHKLTISAPAEDCRFSFSLFLCPQIFGCGLYYGAIVFPILFLDKSFSQNIFTYVQVLLPFLCLTCLPIIFFYCLHISYTKVFKMISDYYLKELRGYYSRTTERPEDYALLDMEHKNVYFSTEKCLFFVYTAVIMVPVCVCGIFVLQIIHLFITPSDVVKIPVFLIFMCCMFTPVLYLSSIFLCRCFQTGILRDSGPETERNWNGIYGVNIRGVIYFAILFCIIFYATEKCVLFSLFLLSFYFHFPILIPFILIWLEIFCSVPLFAFLYVAIIASLVNVSRRLLIRLNMLLNYYQGIALIGAFCVIMTTILVILKSRSSLVDGILSHWLVFVPFWGFVLICMFLNCNLCCFSAHCFLGKRYLSWRDKNINV